MHGFDDVGRPALAFQIDAAQQECTVFTLTRARLECIGRSACNPASLAHI